MARGMSGRIVIEVEPELKRRLYAVLAMSGSTLKDWFVASASQHCDRALQPDLFSASTGEGVKEDRRLKTRMQVRRSKGR
jgi:hypothetical protein